MDEKICSGCEACLSLCPTEAIKMQGDYAFVMALFCKGCGYCIEGCGEEAIRLLDYAPI